MALSQKFYSAAFIVLLSLTVNACDNNDCVDSACIQQSEFSTTSLPVVNGIPVSANAYPETLMLYSDANFTKAVFCTAVLISPDWVLTAIHCVKSTYAFPNLEEEVVPYMHVGIGSTVESVKNTYEVDKIYVPDNALTSDSIKKDIALIHLKTPIPSEVALAVPPMPPSKELSAKAVDNGYDEASASSTVELLSMGFGQISGMDTNSSGIKHMATTVPFAICPMNGTQSARCTDEKAENKGVIFIDGSKASLCRGDSGGPTYRTVDGYRFVEGISSYSDKGCQRMSALTLVSDYYDSFIKAHVPNLVEDCDNGVDDNGDGFVDCSDWQCRSLDKCDVSHCSAENCGEFWCSEAKICQPEVCDNKSDDNGDGKVDCDDPQCAEFTACLHEICDNQKDDNGDGKVDCDDDECQQADACNQEICGNRVDDNGDGKVDCDDPKCADEPMCQVEICDDQIDNNVNMLTDCDDPACAEAEVCQASDSSDDGCAVASRRPARHAVPALFALLGAALVWRRRQKTSTRS